MSLKDCVSEQIILLNVLGKRKLWDYVIEIKEEELDNHTCSPLISK